MNKTRIAITLFISLAIAACGGGSSDTSSSTQDTASAPPAMGMIGLFLTDKPSDEFAQINVNVTEAVLIGDGGQQSVFQGSRKINLLDLTNYSEPLIFGEAAAGTYAKIRLYIDELQLVPHDRSANIYPKLPANGKIDLLDQGGFEVVAGRLVIIEIDMDANNSIKITETGQGRKYNFRPVVKVNITDGGLPNKLVRIEGIVKTLPAEPAGRLVVCAVDMPENCVDVQSNGATSFFDEDGLATDFAALMVNDPVVVIGRYQIDAEVLLKAKVIEIGGTAEQISGKVVSKPVDGKFLLLRDNGSEVIVEIQKNTLFFAASGKVEAETLDIGTNLEIEGVFPPQVNNIGPSLFRAALVFIEAEDSDQLSGTIIEPLDIPNRSFGLSVDGGSDTCILVDSEASILLVDTAASEVTKGSIDDLELGQAVDLFGDTATDSCLVANDVIVHIDSAP